MRLPLSRPENSMPSSHMPIGRRHFLASAAIGAVAACLPTSAANAATLRPGPGAQSVMPAQTVAEAALGPSMIVGAAAPDTGGDAAVRPFHYRASDPDIAELKRRIRATRWPDRETVKDDTQGVQADTMRKLADY